MIEQYYLLGLTTILAMFSQERYMQNRKKTDMEIASVSCAVTSDSKYSTTI